MSISPAKRARLNSLHDEIRHLHDQGISNRQIEKRLGLSRKTVSKILRQDREQEELETRPSPPPLPQPVNPYSQEYNGKHGLDQFVVKYERCTSCGGKVQVGVPCLTCRVRRMMVDEFECYLRELLATNSTAYPITQQLFSSRKETHHVEVD